MARCRIELETRMHSQWVSRVLGELGHEVIVRMPACGDRREPKIGHGPPRLGPTLKLSPILFGHGHG